METSILLLLASLLVPMSSEYLLGAGLPALVNLIKVALDKKYDPYAFEQLLKKSIEPSTSKKMFWWPSVSTLGAIIAAIFASGSHLNYLGGISLIAGPLIVIIAAVVLEDAPFDSPALWAEKLRKNLMTRYLAGSKNPNVHQYLLAMVKKRSISVWKQVVMQVAADPRTEDIPLLEAGAVSPDREVASAAVNALFRIAPKHLNDRVKYFLKVSRKGVVKAALLENIHKLDPQVAALLLEKSRPSQVKLVKDKVAVADQVMLTRQILDTVQEKIEDKQYKRYLTGLRKLKEELSSGTWQSVQAARMAVKGYDTFEDWGSILKELQRENEPSLIPVIRQLEKLPGRHSLNALLGLAGEENEAVRKLLQLVLADRKELKQQNIEKLLRSAQMEKREVGIGLVMRLPEERQVPALFKALADKVIRVQVAGLRSLQKLRWRKEFLHLLEKATGSKNPEVLKLAFEIAGEYGQRDILPALFKAYDNWEGNHVQEKGNYYYELKAAIDAVLTQDPTFTRRSGLLYCPNCIARTAYKKIFEWKIPVCKVCQEYEALETGVQAIVGVIGPLPDQREVATAIRVCSVWDPGKKQVIHREIDGLEIINGGNFDYDWALSAVMELLETRRKKKGKPLPIRLTKQPPLSANSRTIVKDYESQ